MIELVLFFIACVWICWLGFVAIMHLRKVREKWGLTLSQKLMGYPALVFFFLLDVFLRCTVFLLMDWRVRLEWIDCKWFSIPFPETVSAMLARLVKEDSIRGKVSRWIRQDWLADFDPTGSHGEPERE